MAELTKKQIKKAQKEKHCPFCEGQDFRATFDLSGRDFWVENGKIKLGEREEEEIEVVQCNICLEEVPDEVWGKWNIKAGE
ncbi:unnamed protein product [marine sediment metagenome]|uniref:Uncharacterized protein n=1 Tax=marine sediment metagenome TaxID=412755 RepID=X1ENA8_9ZZZZ